MSHSFFSLHYNCGYFFKIGLICLFFACNPAVGYAQFSSPPNNKAEYDKQYKWRIQQERLYGVYIPKSIDEAMLEMDRLTDESSKRKFAALPEEEAFRKLYFSLRLWLIQNWGFEGGSRFTRLLEPLGLKHPDDIAELTIILWHRHLHQKDRDLKKLVVSLREKRKSSWEAQKAKDKRD